MIHDANRRSNRSIRSWIAVKPNPSSDPRSYYFYVSRWGISIVQRHSKLWLATILCSSVVTGGGSFVLLTLLTDLPFATVVAISAALVVAGDIALAFFMQAVSPTRVTLGPGDRRHRSEAPRELGRVESTFEGRRGRVSIRGETWRARQAVACGSPLAAGAAVRVVEREGLTLVVAAAD